MTLSFYVISSQREFSNRKNSGVMEEVSDVNKSLCKNILFVNSCLCASPLVCAPPQLTLFTSPTTPSTPQFSTIEIWQSPDKLTGKCRTQIYVYVYIYMRSLFRSARLGWIRPPLQTTWSIPNKTRIPVGQPIRIRSRDRPCWKYPFEGGRYCCWESQWWPGGSKKMGEGCWWTVHIDLSIDRSIHQCIDWYIYQSINPSIHWSIHQSNHPSIHRSISSTNPLIHLSIYHAIDLSIDQSIHRSINPSIHPSMHWSIHPSIHQSKHPSIHRYIDRSIHRPIHWSIDQ